MCPNKLKVFQIFPMMSKGTLERGILKKRKQRRNYSGNIPFAPSLQRLPWMLAETNDSYGSTVLSQVDLPFQNLPSSVQLCSQKAPASAILSPLRVLTCHAIWPLAPQLTWYHLGLAFAYAKFPSNLLPWTNGSERLS